MNPIASHMPVIISNKWWISPTNSLKKEMPMCVNLPSLKYNSKGVWNRRIVGETVQFLSLCQYSLTCPRDRHWDWNWIHFRVTQHCEILLSIDWRNDRIQEQAVSTVSTLCMISLIAFVTVCRTSIILCAHSSSKSEGNSITRYWIYCSCTSHRFGNTPDSMFKVPSFRKGKSKLWLIRAKLSFRVGMMPDLWQSMGWWIEGILSKCWFLLLTKLMHPGLAIKMLSKWHSWRGKWGNLCLKLRRKVWWFLNLNFLSLKTLRKLNIKFRRWELEVKGSLKKVKRFHKGK